MECSNQDTFGAVARDHAVHPRNLGPLKTSNGHARITGPCGDTMEFWMHVTDTVVEQVTFVTNGCGASHACGSMATTLAEGKTVAQVAAMCEQEILHALGGLPSEFEHCALLAANTIKAACADFQRRRDAGAKAAASQSTCEACAEAECSASRREQHESDAEFEDRRKLQSRLCRIRHKIVVLSGKGGVGKSTVAVNLATALMMAGHRVGLLDVDVHGPSIPTMLGLEGESPQQSDEGLTPIELGDMKVMSLGFLLRNQDDPVIWRGPMKMGVIKQFITDVLWGDLDYLIIDSPPGTGDEPLSVCQLIVPLDGAVIVTTPQKVAAVDVRKSVSFCRQLHVPVLGLVENMSGFRCPTCGEITQILPSGGGKRIAEDMHVPFLGAIPMDPNIAATCDNGRAFVHHFAGSPAATILQQIIAAIILPDKTSPDTGEA